MAMRIRCTDCSKKISIDEAFAGGVCRCPYCKALVQVSGTSDASAGATRPAAPTERPESPEPIPAGASEADVIATAEVAGQEHIPTARPVRLQGIVTLVLLGAMLLMLAAGVVGVITFLTGDDYGTVVDVTNPFIPNSSGPAIAGMPVDTPVVYIIDGGSSMRNMRDYGIGAVYASVRSLRSRDEFAIILAGEEADTLMDGGYHDGDDEGRKAAWAFLDAFEASGAADISRAMRAAMALDPQPDTIVLVAQGPMVDQMAVAKEAAQKGIVLLTVALDSNLDFQAMMESWATLTGGQSQWYGFAMLSQFSREAPPNGAATHD